jgi:hypothetical protein
MFFDIETCPLPGDVIAARSKGFVAEPFVDKPFKPNANWKLETAAAKKYEYQLKAEERRQEHEEKQRKAEEEHWNGVSEKATLLAHHSYVCAICYWFDGAQVQLAHSEDREVDLLEQFWDRAYWVIRHGYNCIGFNISGFDLPFLVRRSLIQDVKIKINPFVNNRYLKDGFVDIADYWKGTDYRGYLSLDILAKSLGFEGKPEGVTGDMFHKLLKEDPEKAEEYALNEGRLMYEVACRFKEVGLLHFGRGQGDDDRWPRS